MSQGVNYIEGEDLAEALRECFTAGVLSDRVAEMAGEVARRAMYMGVGRGFGAEQRDEVLREVYWQLMRRWRKIDPDGNPFAYLTGMVRFAVGKVARQAGAQSRVAEVAALWEEDRGGRRLLSADLEASAAIGPQRW